MSDIVIRLRLEIPRDALKWAKAHNGDGTVRSLRAIIEGNITALCNDLQYDYENDCEREADAQSRQAFAEYETALE